MSQILDDNFHHTPSPPRVVTRVWYLWHAAMITALLLFISIMLFGILPFLPDFIEKPLNETLLPLLIFGMYGISFYTYFKGFKWGVLWSFLAATFTFLFSFILIMSNLDDLETYFKNFLILFSSDKDFSSFVILGVGYNILMVFCTEGMMMLGWTYWKWKKGRNFE